MGEDVRQYMFESDEESSSEDDLEDGSSSESDSEDEETAVGQQSATIIKMLPVRLVVRHDLRLVDVGSRHDVYGGEEYERS